MASSWWWSTQWWSFTLMIIRFVPSWDWARRWSCELLRPIESSKLIQSNALSMLRITHISRQLRRSANHGTQTHRVCQLQSQSNSHQLRAIKKPKLHSFRQWSNIWSNQSINTDNHRTQKIINYQWTDWFGGFDYVSGARWTASYFRTFPIRSIECT